MSKYQVTFYSKDGSLKPIATIIEADSRTEIFEGKWKDAATKICTKHRWTYKEMKTTYGYTTFKCRPVETK